MRIRLLIQNWKDGKIVLFIGSNLSSSCRLDYSQEDDCYFISNLYVDEKYRGLMYGTKIIERIEKYALDLNKNCYLELKSFKKSWVHEWYKRIGFNDSSRTNKNGYVYMRKYIGGK